MKVHISLFASILVSAALMGCGDGADSSDTNAPAPVVTDSGAPGATCVPNEQKECQCKDGADGKQACAKDGKSFSECICVAKPDAGTDADTEVKCDGRPVGYVITYNCCDDGSDGYMVCQKSGHFEGCYGCQPKQNDAGTDADAGSDADAPATPIITATLNPLANTTLDFGLKAAHLFDVTVCSTKDVEITRYDFGLQGVFGGKLVGSQGSKYFTNIKLVDGTVTVAGPKELGSPAGTIYETLSFIDAYQIAAGHCRSLALLADISDYEDAIGELSGQTYAVTQHKPEARYVGTSDKVAIEDIVVNGEQGNLLTVKTAQPIDALKAELSDLTPPSGIRIAGKANDAAFTTYTVTNTANQPIVFDHVNVQAISADGFSGPEYISLFRAQIKNFSMISGGAIDQIGATQIGPVNPGETATLSPGESADLHISASLQGAMPTSIPDQPGIKQPRSGGQLRIQMFTLYKGTHQVVGTAGYEQPNLMVVRKSKPILAKAHVADTTLTNAEQDLLKFTIGADEAGPIAIKTLKFSVAKVAMFDPFTLDNFKLRRGDADIDPSAYVIMTDGTVGGSGLTMGPDMPKTNVTVVFAQEEVISGSGNVYTLHATVSGANYASAVITSLLGKENDLENVTGQIYSFYPTYLSITNMQQKAQFFIWSDMSELPHSAQMDGWTGNPVSSMDWTNGLHVESLEISQTLSK